MDGLWEFYYENGQLKEKLAEIPMHRLTEEGGVAFRKDFNKPFTGVAVVYKEGLVAGKRLYEKGIL